MKSQKMQIPFWEAISIILAISLLFFIVLPSYSKSSKESSDRYVLKVATTIKEIINSDYQDNLSDPSILLAASSRVNPGLGVEIKKELTPGFGIVVKSKSSLACVKLSTTGAVAFNIISESEC